MYTHNIYGSRKMPCACIKYWERFHNNDKFILPQIPNNILDEVLLLDTNWRLALDNLHLHLMIL